MAVLIAIGVDQDGYREVLGVSEGTKEDSESWRSFLRHLKERGLAGVKLFVTDKSLGLIEALAEFYPESAWQLCVVHFYRNLSTAVPSGKFGRSPRCSRRSMPRKTGRSQKRKPGQ